MVVYESFIFLIGIVLLVKGADFIVNYASKIATKWGVSEFTIGTTLVAGATSIPEIAISVNAGLTTLLSSKATIDIATGTVLGSNIANIGLILGLAAAIKFIPISNDFLRQENFMLALTFLFAATLFVGLSLVSGSLLIAFVVAYLIYLGGRRTPLTFVSGLFSKLSSRASQKDLAFAVLGALGVIIGSTLVVDSVITISSVLGIPKFLIAVIAVAIGTSLPELSASVVAAVRGVKSIAIGNIIGSNIFNIFGLAITSLFIAVPVTSKILFLAVPAMLIFSVILFVFMKTRLQISKKEGITLIALYAVFLSLELII